MKTGTKAAFFIALIFCDFGQVHASDEGGRRQNLYERMNYEKLFDQKKILSKYTDTLKTEGFSDEQIAEFTTDQSARSFSITTRLKQWWCRKRDYHPVAGDEATGAGASHGADATSSTISSAALNKILQADFMAKKQRSMNLAVLIPCISCSAEAGCMAAAATCLPCATGAGFSGFVAVQSVSQGAQRLIPSACNLCCTKLADPLEKYELIYAAHKRFLPPDLQDKIEDTFSTGRKSDMSLGQTLNFLNIALNIPLDSKPIEYTAEIEEAIDNLVTGYENATAIGDALKGAIFTHVRQYNALTGMPNTNPRVQIYLHGEPGTGKSFLMKNIAMLLGLPFIDLTATTDIDAMLGTAESPGSLLSNLSGAKAKRNALVCIDEAPEALNQEGPSAGMFKKVLEPSEKYYKSPYLNAQVDMSHLCIVAAGNSPLTTEAMKSRFINITMGKMTTAFKMKILLAKFKGQGVNNSQLKAFIQDAMNVEDSDGQRVGDEAGIRNLEKLVESSISRYQRLNHIHPTRAAAAGAGTGVGLSKDEE